MIHDIKIMEIYADAVLSGDKTFEIRENDRNYQRGDIVRFHVVTQGSFFATLPMPSHPLNGQKYVITYVLSGWGIPEGHVVFSIKPAKGGGGDGIAGTAG